MQKIVLAVGIGLAASLVVLANPASAGGVGACVLGNGFDFYAADIPGPYTGVNVGTTSETNVFSDPAAYEAQCCAEAGQAPDCFAPVEP